ncbi:MAG: TonB-dependent receptor [Proteobacteria bacterium]|nr:TonB-dependent receptor [Pseudomonadota bacterium]
MNKRLRFLRSSLVRYLQCGVTAALAVVLLALPVAGIAQETSSAIRGAVTDESGTPLPNSTVTVRNPDTGLTRSVQTNASGEFSIRNLPVGYEYTVEVSSDGYGGKRIENLSLNLGKTAEANFDLVASGAIEEIIVTESRLTTVQVAVGPSATFTLADLQSAPSINRDINDVIRLDPRIYVDESRQDINAVQCGGKNPRFNSLTVDGVRMNDSFGLNSNGYPTERMPFSFDAINQVSVELAPFDVEYGGFSACNINAVTKSGGNEFFGSAFYDFTSDSLSADKLEGDTIQSNSFDKSRYGITFGGPIIEDKLFFFVAYEKLDGANLFDRGPQGSGAVNEILVTQAELDEIALIADTLYQFDVGPIPGVLDNEDEKLLLKLDWNISDEQRLAFTYNYNDGFNNTRSDSDQNEFEFSKHLYFRGTEMDSYSATLYSDWTSNFSTEFRLSYIDVENTHESLGGTDFGEIRVELADVDVYLGGDDSRQANKLIFDVLTFALKGNLDLDNGHNLTFGIEREDLDVFNLFVQHTDTEIRFDGIQNFRDGFASAIYYNNAPSNNQNDAAAVWGYALNAVYGQDEFDIGDRLTIVAGLRYDWYTTSDIPGENPDFVADYGFSNSTNLDGEGLLQPRLGFTFDLSGDTTIRGGVGLYTGGNPNVWLSNNFSANNVLQFGQRGRSFGYTDGTRSLFDANVVWSACESGVPVGPGYCIPSELFDAVAGGVGDNFDLNYLDPNFELPSEWKFALGVTHTFPGDYVVTADVLLTRTEDSAIVLHGDLDQVGTDAQGYPDYDSTRELSFVLTNSNETSDSVNFSLGLTKAFDNGFDVRVGYAFSDAEDVNPMTSSVAFSNYQNRAFFDPQEDISSTSNYNIEHRLTFATTWRKAFFGDYDTTISLYGSANSGRPYSVSYNGTFMPYFFTPFLDDRDNVLLPGVARNAETGSWWRKIDLRINVDFPGFRPEDRASAFIVIDNLTNLLNDDWGVLRQYNFPRTVVDGTPEPRIGDASRYEIWFGVQYQF